VLAGLDNSGGHGYLGASERSLGRVVRGRGETGASGLVGVRRGTVVGG
jgi:CobQ-like glutamine amidotransferase family enzyme